MLTHVTELSGPVLSRLLSEAKDGKLPDTQLVASNCVVSSMSKYVIANRAHPFFLHSQLGHRVSQNTATWDYEGQHFSSMHVFMIYQFLEDFTFPSKMNF